MESPSSFVGPAGMESKLPIAVPSVKESRSFISGAGGGSMMHSRPSSPRAERIGDGVSDVTWISLKDTCSSRGVGSEVTTEVGVMSISWKPLRVSSSFSLSSISLRSALILGSSSMMDLGAEVLCM